MDYRKNNKKDYRNENGKDNKSSYRNKYKEYENNEVVESNQEQYKEKCAKKYNWSKVNEANKGGYKKADDFSGNSKKDSNRREYNRSEDSRREDNIRDKKKDFNSSNKRKDFGKANKNIKKVISKCPAMGKCGGCQWLDMPYEQQLARKQQLVGEFIGEFVKVDKIIGMDNPENYRNKVHGVFSHDRKGNPIAGVFEEKSHNVIPINSCYIEDKKAREIIESIRSLLKSFKIKTYDEDSGYGLLRYVMVRTGFQSGEIMVVLVLSSSILPSKNNFVKALLKLQPEITTIIINVNDKKTSMVLGDKEQTIYGKGYIEDTLCGKTFRISSKSFYQVNPVQTQVLYSKAIELGELDGSQIILDAYCGIGTIGILASSYAKHVIGVELNKDAVKDAIINAKINKIKNIDFYNQDAGKFMVELARENENIDVVFMDPPRNGSDEVFINSVVSLAPKKVVYISCNPETLGRDLKVFNANGYKVNKALPVDMFPATAAHVETICLLEK